MTDKITTEELKVLFGNKMPICAVDVLSWDNIDIEVTRSILVLISEYENKIEGRICTSGDFLTVDFSNNALFDKIKNENISPPCQPFSSSEKPDSQLYYENGIKNWISINDETPRRYTEISPAMAYLNKNGVWREWDDDWDAHSAILFYDWALWRKRCGFDFHQLTEMEKAVIQDQIKEGKRSG